MSVTLWKSGPGRRLAFVSNENEGPVSDVALTSPDGYEIARTRPGQSWLYLPAWVGGVESLIATSPGTYPCFLATASLGNEVVTLPGLRVARITVEDLSGCGGTVTLMFSPSVSEPPSGVNPLVPKTLIIAPPAEMEVEIPAGVSVVVSASNPCGAVGHALLAEDDPHPSERIALEVGKTLSVHVLDDSGASISSARVLADGYGAFTSSRGLIRVPVTTRLSSFTVMAEGYRSVVMSRSVHSELPAEEGEVRLVLEPAVKATYLVCARGGRALPGMRVSVLATSSAVDLGGDGGWVADRVRESTRGTTDSSGSLQVTGLAAGAVDVAVDLPPEMGTDDLFRSAYPAVDFRLDLSDGGEYTLEVPAPRNVMLEVFDAESGKPVRGFELRTADEGAAVAVEGSHWQGWISDELERLHVVVQGLGSARVDTESAAADQVLRVLVRRRPQVLVRVLDLPAAQQELELNVQVMKASPAGLHLDHVVDMKLGPSGEASLDPGDVADPVIGIAELKLNGIRLRFDPEFVTVVSGGVVEFRCVKFVR